MPKFSAKFRVFYETSDLINFRDRKQKNLKRFVFFCSLYIYKKNFYLSVPEYFIKMFFSYYYY